MRYTAYYTFIFTMLLTARGYCDYASQKAYYLNLYRDVTEYHDCIIEATTQLEKDLDLIKPSDRSKVSIYFSQQATPPGTVTIVYLSEGDNDIDADTYFLLEEIDNYHCRNNFLLPSDKPILINTKTKPKDPRKKICPEPGSVINFNNKTVAESIPIEGTGLQIYYSSDYNNKIQKNFKIENRYTLLSNIGSKYKLDIVEPSTNQIYSSMQYLPSPPYIINGDFEVPESSPLWSGSDIVSKANIRFNLNRIEYDYESGRAMEFQVDTTDRNIIKYNAAVWGLSGWTVSEHHFFDSESKTLFKGTGERVEYSDYKQINDPELGPVLVVINKVKENELFIFSQSGVHLETRNAIQGYKIHKFSYEGKRLRSISDRFGNTTNFIYVNGEISEIASPYGVETKFEVSGGNLVTVSDPEFLTYAMTYDDKKLLKKFKSASGVETTFIYSETGNFLREEKNTGLFQSFAENLISMGSEFVHSVGFGTVKKVQSFATPDGHEVRIVDKNNRLISRSISSYTENTSIGGFENDWSTDEFSPSSDWGFDKIVIGKTIKQNKESGQDIKEIRSHSESKSYSDNNVLNLNSYQSVDSLNGVPLLNSNFEKSSNTLLLSNSVGVSEVSSFNQLGQLTSLQSSGRYPTSFEYDSHGRLEKVTKGQQFTKYLYDQNGYLEFVTNSKNQQTKYVRNKKGQLLSEILPNQDRIDYTYFDSGEIKTVKAPNNKIHRFNLSLGDYIESSITPRGKSTNFQYDENKRLISITKPSGKTINIEYEEGTDAVKRILTPDGNMNYNIRDTRQRVRSATSEDNINTETNWVSNSIQSEKWYDNGEFVAELSRTFFSDKFRESSIKLNNSVIAKFNYNSAGILENIENLGFSYSRQYEINKRNLKVSGSNLEVNYTAEDSDNGNKPTLWTSLKLTDNTQSQLFLSIKRSFDTFGQANGFTMATLNQDTNVFNTYYSLVPEYDDNDRLIKLSKIRKSYVNGQQIDDVDFENKYVYSTESNNNIRMFQHIATESKQSMSTYNDDDQLIKIEGSVNREYKFNDDGELAEMTNCFGTTKYFYNSHSDLKRVEFPNGKIVEYKVDALNRRFKKLVNGVTKEYYIWYDQTRLAAILDPNKSPKIIFVYGDEAVNTPSYIIKNGKTFKVIHDPGLESVRYVIDSETSTTVQELEYDEFGNILKDTNPEFQPIAFAGGLYDIDTKLLKFGAREYDPTTGRWTTKDPIGFAGGDANLYAYVGGNPMSKVDPDGHQPALPNGFIQTIPSRPPPRLLEPIGPPSDTGPFDPDDICAFFADKCASKEIFGRDLPKVKKTHPCLMHPLDCKEPPPKYEEPNQCPKEPQEGS